MINKSILISGPAISIDIGLTGQLQKLATVLTNIDNTKIESIITSTKIDLILLEIEEIKLEIEVIKNIKLLYPEIEIVIVVKDEKNQDVIAKAFKCGVRDAFRKPYKIALIVGRLKALLRQNDANLNIHY